MERSIAAWGLNSRERCRLLAGSVLSNQGCDIHIGHAIDIS
jgi:hypothetical protein